MEVCKKRKKVADRLNRVLRSRIRSSVTQGSPFSNVIDMIDGNQEELMGGVLVGSLNEDQLQNDRQLWDTPFPNLKAEVGRLPKWGVGPERGWGEGGPEKKAK